MTKKKPNDEAKKQEREQTRKLAAELRKQEDEQWKAFVEETVTKMGRPQLYDPTYCDEVIRYFLSKPPYRTVMTMLGPKEIANDLPTLAELAVRIGVRKKTINNWINEHEEFLRA